MVPDARSYLSRQFETVWRLTDLHLNDLSTEECLWRPAQVGLHVYQGTDDSWYADWTEHETYELGPSSIAWLTWHLGFWWSMVINHSFGNATLQREDIFWPGDADSVRHWILQLHSQWVQILQEIHDDELQSFARTRWPYTERPFGDVIAWVNIELMKNAAEIGYVRFLYAVRGDNSSNE